MNEGISRKYSGKELAKILIYYGLIDNINSLSFNICCPFHDDTSPSMLINLENGSYYCFCCDISGNAFDFVQLVHPDYNELEVCLTIEKILKSKKVSGLVIRGKRRRKEDSQKAIEEAKTFYYGLAENNWYSPRTDEEMEILHYMEQRHFKRKDLQNAGARATYDIVYPVVFPIYDNGEFRGYVSRTFNRNVEKIRKYLYNDGFRKRETICGTYEKGCVPVICEGYLDYLSLKSRAGHRNVIALLGWHLSDGQYEKLKAQGITKVISALDNDTYGEKGTRYLSKFFEVIRYPFPKGVKDAGDMSVEQLRKARRELKEYEYMY